MRKSQNVKILYLISRFSRSGPINLLFNLVKYINKEKFNVYILTLDKEVEDSIMNKFYNYANLFSIESSFKYNLPIILYRATKVVSNIQPDIIHSHGFRADLVNSLLPFKESKKISTVHNYPQYDYCYMYGYKIGYISYKLHLVALRKLNCVIGVSEGVTKNLLNLYGRNDIFIRTVKNFVDPEIFYPVDNDIKITLRKKYKLPLYDKIFVFSGKLIRRKNIEVLIKAFSKLRSRKIKLLIVGNGPEEERLRYLINKIDAGKYIILRQFTENIDEMYKLSDFYISSSLAEGLPMSVLEAVMCGLPLVLSDIEPHREVLEGYECLSKFLFNPNDIDEIANKIHLITEYDYDMLRKIILEISVKYNAKYAVKNYEDLYFLLNR